MTLSNAKRDREYQHFKDSELFGNVLAATSAGSITLNPEIAERVGDVLLVNSGSTDCFYNFGTSGGGVVASTSGTLLIAGAERSYEDVGFDVFAFITSAGVSKVYVHKIFSGRP